VPVEPLRAISWLGVGNEATRVHNTGRRRGSCVAARRERPAEGKLRLIGVLNPGSTDYARNRRVLRRAAGARLRRGFEHSDRATLRRLEYGSIPATRGRPGSAQG